MTHRALVVIAGLGVLAGCGGRPIPELADAPDDVVILSIDGRPRHEAEEPPPEAAKVETVHGYPVLGRVAIGDPGQRREVVERVRQAIRDGPGQPARCFIPRHVVRVAKGGSVTDVVVCFECLRYRVYRDGQDEPGTGRTIASDAQPYFDKLLTDAAVPLAPRE